MANHAAQASHLPERLNNTTATTPFPANIRMKTHLRLISLCPIGLILCSCAVTSVKETWKSPNSQTPLGKVAVVALAERGMVRQGFENRFAAQLREAGVPSVVTFKEFSTDQAKLDKEAATERLRTMGAQAVLIARAVDVSSSYRETQPGGESVRGVITGIETDGWYDYYSVGFTSWNSTYGSLKQTLCLEVGLFDLKTQKRVWSAITRTVFKEDADKVAEMDPIVAKIVAAMRKDGVL